MDKVVNNFLYLNNIIEFSTVDWPGKSVSVIFTEGCPMRCHACFQKNLFELNEQDKVSVEYVLNQITYNTPLIDGVVFSGGEPLSSSTSSLIELMDGIHNLGLKVGLETNGYYPFILHGLIINGKVDKVFLDIKGALTWEKQQEATGVCALSEVSRSLLTCFETGIPFDVRTTIFPKFPNLEDLLSIGYLLKGYRNVYPENQFGEWKIQQGLPSIYSEEFKPVSARKIDKIASKLRNVCEFEEIKS